MVISWKDVKARRTSISVKFRSRRLRIRGIVATDEKDLVALQFQMAVQGIDQHLHRSDQDIEGLGEQGDCRVEFDFHNRICVALGI